MQVVLWFLINTFVKAPGSVYKNCANSSGLKLSNLQVLSQ